MSTQPMKKRRRAQLPVLLICYGLYLSIFGLVAILNFGHRTVSTSTNGKGIIQLQENIKDQGFIDNNQEVFVPALRKIHRKDDVVQYDSGNDYHLQRHLLAAEEGPVNCTPRALDQFPGDFFTEEQRKQGGVAVHFVISLYLLLALAIVCDDYFVASLEQICDALKLQPDVAGATFMAAGSSAPELFTSVIGLFFAKSDVGVGTIVGSAVFNILFTVALCGLFAGMVIYLTWWPLVRDCFFYMLSVVALIVIIFDEKIHWYEATVMLVMYIIYIIIMYFNQKIGDFFTHKVNQCRTKEKYSQNVRYTANEKSPLLGETFKKSEEKVTEEDSDVESSLSTEQQNDKCGDENSQTESEKEDYVSPWTFPDSWGKRFLWLLALPVTFFYFITIPDCRRPGCWRKAYLLTFLVSVIWIALESYVLVWMVTTIGDTLGIPDTVMGLTLLAAGTSVPDSMSSILVARDGLGDMAISNSIGSNVFDILICLGLPWLLQTSAINPNGIVTINSAGLSYSSITLLSTVVFLFVLFLISGWKLNKKLGVICIVVYVLVIAFSCLFELNVFGQLNPPPCPR